MNTKLLWQYNFSKFSFISVLIWYLQDMDIVPSMPDELGKIFFKKDTVFLSNLFVLQQTFSL